MVLAPGLLEIPAVLLVDDNAALRDVIREDLETHGWSVRSAESVGQARDRIGHERYTAAIVDYSLPDGNAFDLLPLVRAADPRLPFIVLTGQGSIDLAVRAIQLGVNQFLTKPVDLVRLRTELQGAIDGAERRTGGEAVGAPAEPDPFLGTSLATRRLREDTCRLLAVDRPILILGETGVGKGVLASWIHRRSPQARMPFVDLNCAGLSKEFLESELFGHERGAFTGASSSKTGLLEAAGRGMLLLDEIGDTDLEVQAKLLKVLDDRTFRRLGAVRVRKSEARIVAATLHDLGELVRQGRFREDLYYRISAMPLRIPALRERREDIVPLARWMLEQLGGRALELTPAAEEALTRDPWPGNIRQLRNVLDRAVTLSPTRVIDVHALRFEPVTAPPADDPGSLTLEEVQRLHVQRMIDLEGGHVERAARRLGIPRSTLYELVRRLGIHRSE